MQRILLPCVVLFVMLAVAPAANAQLTTLYTTIDGPQTVQGVTRSHGIELGIADYVGWLQADNER